MAKRKLLFFFTASFPYGKDEAFIEDEIKVLCAAFDKVIIITNNISGNKRPLPVNATIEYLPYNLTSLEKISALHLLTNQMYAGEADFVKKVYKLEISHLIRKIILTSIYKARKTERFILQLQRTYAQTDDILTLYSYWMNDMAIGCALTKAHHNSLRFVTRVHGWDLYAERHTPPYLPFRKFISAHADQVCFISHQGLNYFKNTYNISKGDNLVVNYLGTSQRIIKECKRDNNTLRLASCSSVIPLKQLDRIAETLSLIPDGISVEWTHLGGGPELENLTNLAHRLFSGKSHIQFHFTGALTHEEVIHYFNTHAVDLFINASRYEGLPVSLMEAFSFGIPAMAPHIGGISEIIDPGLNGYIFNPDASPQHMAALLIEFMQLPDYRHQEMRLAAYKKWEQLFNSEKNYTDFTHRILLPA